MRRKDWEERLNILITLSLGQRFEWGKFDCCTFAADGVLACTGRDVMGDLRGTYGSLKAAYRLIEHEGGILAAVTKRLGAVLDNPNFAQRGDIVLHTVEGFRALAVVTGSVALAPMVKGVQRISAQAWHSAWRVD